MALFKRKRADERTPEPMPQGTGQASGDELADLVFGSQPDAVYVNARTAAGLPALDAGVTLIASQVAQMMVAADVLDANGQPITPTPTIVRRPFPAMTATEWWEMVLRSLLMHGNAYALPFEDQLIPLDPAAVSVDVSTGLPVYRVGALDHVFGWDELWHVRRFATPGTWVGLGIVAKFRKAVEGQLHEQAFGTNSYKSGAVPSAVITLDAANVTKEVAEAYQERWIERHGGGNRKPAVVPKTVSITPISWNAQDMQFVESMQLSVAQAAYMCGLSPSDLEAGVGGTALTYANVEQRTIQRITQVYQPLVNLFEESLSDLLPMDQTVRGNAEALLRSTTRERFELYALGRDLRIYTDAELRELEHRPPLT